MNTPNAPKYGPAQDPRKEDLAEFANFIKNKDEKALFGRAQAEFLLANKKLPNLNDMDKTVISTISKSWISMDRSIAPADLSMASNANISLDAIAILASLMSNINSWKEALVRQTQTNTNDRIRDVFNK